MKFESIDEKWLEFVYQNRQKIYYGELFDVIIGAVADDTIYRVFRLYETGVLDKKQTKGLKGKTHMSCLKSME